MREKGTLAGCSVTISEHLGQSWRIRHDGPHVWVATKLRWPCPPEPKQNGRRKTVKKVPHRKSPGLSHVAWESSRLHRGFPAVTTAVFSQTAHILCSKKTDILTCLTTQQDPCLGLKCRIAATSTERPHTSRRRSDLWASA